MVLDAFDRTMLEFFVMWAPYGGPPEDEVLPEFGMSRTLLLHRVAEIVEGRLKAYVPRPERALLLRAAHELRRGGF
ncbi:hypothetical protein ACNUDN_29710 [Mycobacterium sp. smrl_JER01]|uniref:hypothetical protein n=1 Tax=Mycobacterium sp. smrl_JER01 TaxID=3402633 RepID=UPI003AD0F49C